MISTSLFAGYNANHLIKLRFHRRVIETRVEKYYTLGLYDRLTDDSNILGLSEGYAKEGESCHKKSMNTWKRTKLGDQGIKVNETLSDGGFVEALGFIGNLYD